MTGSTALGEALDPEDLRALLRRYYEAARDVVGEHGGTIEKFIGDAVMAVFGLPRAHGDDPARALAAALALRDRVRGDPRLGDRLPIRLGVATGEVVATRDAAEATDFLVTGDAVNVAARLQQAGTPWSILVAERTLQAAGNGFAFTPLESIAAKGKAQPLRAALLEGRATVAQRRTPLLGRDADLEQLELVARRSFGERRPFLVSLVAPAGTGKTRLLEEFIDRLPSLQADAQVTVAQCLPYGQRLTYWPLRAVLLRLVGLEDDAPAPSVRSAIELWLRRADVEDPERTAGLLAASIGAADVEGIDPSAVFEAWRTAIETAALSGPLVVVFEDLHWSSDPLLDLVDFVLQPRGDLPLLMLVLTRPELLDRRPSWGSGRRNYVSLVLDPLPDDLVGRLVGQLLDGAPVPVVEAIVARADGNPFYAGELVRSLVDHVGPSPDPATIESALGSLPDSVQGAVLARLDVLAPAARRVLQVGSVFGRAFRAAGVAAVDATLADTVGTACDALVERDLIRPAASGFAFRHILIREVAYSTLPRGERAGLHDAAGRWIESASTGTVHAYAELIAFHAREAANLARLLDLDEAEALTARAIDWLRRAGEAAMAAAANVEALRHYRSGAELARGSDLLDLELRIGETRVDGATSAEAYERALALASAGDVPAETRLRALTGILELYTRQQGSVPRRPTPERLEGLFAEARELATDPVVSERARAGLLVAEGFRPFWYRSYAERVVAPDELAASREKVARAADIARRLDDPRLLSAALDAIGSLNRDEGGFRASLAFAEQRIAFQDRLPLDERIDAYAVSIWDSAVLGDFDEADERARAILAQVQPGQLPSWVLHVRAWQAYALLLAGRWDEVVDTMGRGRQLWIDVGRPAAGYALRGFVAASDVAIARRDGVAQAEWREVMQGIADQFERSTPVQRLRQAYARGDLDDMARELAVSHTWTGSPDLVERTVSRLADSGRSVDEGRLTAILQNPALREAQVLAGQLHRAIGMGRQEPEPYRRALEVFDRLGAEPCAARVRCELALLTGEAEILQAGLAALERLGDVERIAAYERQARQRGLAGG